MAGRVAGAGGGGEVLEVIDLEEIVEEEEGKQEPDHGCLQVSQRRHPWWEREKWADVWDEARGWGDLCRDGQRELKELNSGWTKEMDT